MTSVKSASKPIRLLAAATAFAVSGIGLPGASARVFLRGSGGSADQPGVQECVHAIRKDIAGGRGGWLQARVLR